MFYLQISNEKVSFIPSKVSKNKNVTPVVKKQLKMGQSPKAVTIHAKDYNSESNATDDDFQNGYNSSSSSSRSGNCSSSDSGSDSESENFKTMPSTSRQETKTTTDKHQPPTPKIKKISPMPTITEKVKTPSTKKPAQIEIRTPSKKTTRLEPFLLPVRKNDEIFYDVYEDNNQFLIKQDDEGKLCFNDRYDEFHIEENDSYVESEVDIDETEYNFMEDDIEYVISELKGDDYYDEQTQKRKKFQMAGVVRMIIESDQKESKTKGTRFKERRQLNNLRIAFCSYTLPRFNVSIRKAHTKDNTIEMKPSGYFKSDKFTAVYNKCTISKELYTIPTQMVVSYTNLLLVDENQSVDVFYQDEYAKLQSKNICGVHVVSLSEVLEPFERQNNCKIRFARSKLGNQLRILSATRSLSNNIQLRCNSLNDAVLYPLSLGYIPKVRMSDLSRYLEYHLHALNKNRPKRDFDFQEGELDIMMLEYWRLETSDMENIPKNKSELMNAKGLHFVEAFHYTYGLLTKKIKHWKSATGKKYVDDDGAVTVDPNESRSIVITVGQMAHLNAMTRLPTESLLFMKNNLPFMIQHLDEKAITLWSTLFKDLNLHSIVCAHTLNTLHSQQQKYFESIAFITMTMTCDKNPTLSLMCYGLNYEKSNEELTIDIKNHVFQQKDIQRIMSKFYPLPCNVPKTFCIYFDNFFMTTVSWFVRYVKDTGLYNSNFTLENFPYFYKRFAKHIIPQMDSEILPFSYRPYIVSSYKNVIRLNLIAQISKLPKAFTIEDSVIVLLLAMTHGRLTQALCPVLMSTGPLLSPGQFSADCVFQMKMHEHHYIWENDKLESEDRYLPWLMSDDYTYQPHYLANYSRKRKFEEDDFNDYTHDEYTTVSVSIQEDTNDLYAVTDEIGNSENAVESDECTAALVQEIEDLKTLAKINYGEHFTIGKSRQSVLRPLRTDPEPSDVYYNDTQRTLNFMSNSGEHSIMITVPSVEAFAPTISKQVSIETETKRKQLLKQVTGSKKRTLVHLPAFKELVLETPCEKNADDAKWPLTFSSRCTADENMDNYLIVNSLKLFAVGNVERFGTQGNRSFYCALCGCFKFGSRRPIVLDDHYIISSCFICYRRLNYDVTTFNGCLLSSVKNEKAIDSYINVLKERIDNRFIAPLLYDSDNKYSVIKEMKPMKSIADMYTQSYNKMQNNKKRLQPLPQKKFYKQLCEKYGWNSPSNTDQPRKRNKKKTEVSKKIKSNVWVETEPSSSSSSSSEDDSTTKVEVKPVKKKKTVFMSDSSSEGNVTTNVIETARTPSPVQMKKKKFQTTHSKQINYEYASVNSNKEKRRKKKKRKKSYDE